MTPLDRQAAVGDLQERLADAKRQLQSNDEMMQWLNAQVILRPHLHIHPLFPVIIQFFLCTGLW